MHGLNSRHRRKAGSGPPANALIAWIGADPHLRGIVASHRRATAAPLPPNTLRAKAAVAACFVLAGGAILGITAIVNDGLVAPPASILSQDAAAAPDPAAAGGAGSGVRPDPMALPAPSTTQPMTLNRQAQQTIPAPTQAISPRRADPPRHPDRPSAPIKPAAAGKSGPTVTLPRPANRGNSAGSTGPDKPVDSDRAVSTGSGSPVASGNPAGTGNSTDPNNPASSGNLPSTVSRGDSGKPDDKGKPIGSGAAGGDGATPDGAATPGIDQPPSPRISTYGQNTTSAHGGVSADGRTTHLESTSDQGSADKLTSH